MDILKNPVIIGLIAGLLVYSYLVWNQKKKDKKKRRKIAKKTHLIIPAIVAVLIWAVSYGYFKYNVSGSNNTKPMSMTIQPVISGSIPNITPITQQLPQKLNANSDGVHSFSLLNNGVTIPTNLPDNLPATMLPLR